MKKKNQNTKQILKTKYLQKTTEKLDQIFLNQLSAFEERHNEIDKQTKSCDHLIMLSVKCTRRTYFKCFCANSRVERSQQVIENTIVFYYCLSCGASVFNSIHMD